MKNPYIHGKKISQANSFFGRKQELRRIYSLLEGMQQISVVGARRIGKSSLLWCLALPEVMAKYPEFDLSNHVFIYIDLLRCGNYTAEQFLRYVILEIIKVTGLHDIEVPVNGFTYEYFSDALDRVSATELKLVLLFDEFDGVADNLYFDLGFFNFLRSIADDKQVSFVTSSTRSLFELCHKSVVSSPFFNIFVVQELKQLKPNEALELIRLPSTNAGCSLRSDERFILELAGTHPFLLQIACFFVFEAHMSQNSNISYRDIRKAFERYVESHFLHVWQSLGEDEKKQLKSEILAGNEFSHPMFGSHPFREFILGQSSSLRDESLVPLRWQRLYALRTTRIIVGLIVMMTLLGFILTLGFANGVQELLVVVLVAVASWVISQTIAMLSHSRRTKGQ